MPLAAITTEDGDFFRHQGVNWQSIFTAVERNLREGEYSVGGSTIPMQLVKNLFLSPSKILARKFQEILIVALLEHAAAIPKERQLEIYLNVVEFGPGIFGIYDASMHYFGKLPGDLSALEAVWLASILPAPKRFYRFYEDGGVNTAWLDWMHDILETMYIRERLSESEYEEALEQDLIFFYPAESEDAIQTGTDDPHLENEIAE
jgi:membrane peptidoglycan carboxypeptidase